jgi:hypothetical protein
MKKRSREDLDRLEHSLSRTYSAIPAPEFGPEWVEKTMRDIRRHAAEAVGQRTVWMERHVWRTAVLATAFALVFAGSLFFSTGVDVEKGELSAFLSEELEPAPTLLE